MMGRAKHGATVPSQEDLSVQNNDGSNVFMLPGSKKNAKKLEKKEKQQQQHLQDKKKQSKGLQRKLRRLQEEKEKQEMRVQVIETLEKHKLADDAFALLHSSGTLGQEETMRQKLQRAMNYKRAGLQLPSDIPLLRQRAGFDSAEELVRDQDDAMREESVRHTTHSWCLQESAQQMEHNSDANNSAERTIEEMKKRKIHTSEKMGQSIDHKFPEVVVDKNVEMVSFGKEEIAVALPNQDDTVLRKLVVSVTRPDDVEKSREKLPIVMMEQEIMETITENDVVIVCGETGCGKTTQVPQFLFEAGYGSCQSKEKSGVIGVTQPRRVAVLATAKRVAYEMNVELGQEVGFQVRHDRKIGDKSCIKFMTDGILLREVQADFLLSKYSVIVLDEAHERSLNTDILIGILSRILPLRKSMYEEYCRLQQQLRLEGASGSPSAPAINPLKLVIMSATLRVEDFTSNSKMFPCPPPVVQVPARQFPVTVHFSAKTELLDYIGCAEKKVCAIHRKLPGGGILVFLTGQREVELLCRRLRKAFLPRKGTAHTKGKSSCVMFGAGDAEALTGGLGFPEIEAHLEIEADWGTPQSDNEDLSVHGDDDPLSDSDEDDAMDLETSAVVHQDTTKSLVDVVEHNTSFQPGPLHVLPLYAMLPAAAQLQVFSKIPEGARLVVVATNVAETSITIPGIRYVVDAGRSKERDFDRANGVSKYEVRWISKASANQRAGRAGRTGPGHCYRLYSSAIYNNTFPQFAPPEISRVPIEGVVLLMKRMGINKVVNFPFPTAPEPAALIKAEKCLHSLFALDSDTGMLTPTGQAMAVYPISPRHARMLVAALHAAQVMEGKGDRKGARVVVAFAVAAAAAMSLENPFLREIGIGEDALSSTWTQAGGNSKKKGSAASSKDTNAMRQITKEAELESGDGVKLSKGEDEDWTEADKVRRKQRRAAANRAHSRFRNVHSDPLSIVNALWAYEKAENRDEFSELHYLHAKTMQEMANLRQQLSKLVIQHGCDAEAQLIGKIDDQRASHLTKDFLVESAKTWQDLDNHTLSQEQETVLQQAICAGWADRVSHRLSAQERAQQADGKHRKAVRYQACAVEELVYLHPSSAVAKEAPEFVVYNEIITGNRPYMWGVTCVDARWLVSHATPLCTFSKPLADPPPWYDSLGDQVMCWVSPSFGPHLWELPSHAFPMKSSKIRVALFASALLQGKVFPSLGHLLPFLAADPSIIYKPESMGQPRVGELLHKLGAGLNAIDSRSKLASAWAQDSTFLYSEILAWVQKRYQSKLQNVWHCAQQEAKMDVTELYGSRKRKI
ncbi:unnamed protein product [Sphagnum tenellum]